MQCDVLYVVNLSRCVGMMNSSDLRLAEAVSARHYKLSLPSSSPGFQSVLRILYSYLIFTDLFSDNYFRFFNRFSILQLIINLSFATPLVNCKRERDGEREKEMERERDGEREREREKGGGRKGERG